MILQRCYVWVFQGVRAEYIHGEGWFSTFMDFVVCYGFGPFKHKVDTEGYDPFILRSFPPWFRPNIIWTEW